MVSSTKKPAMDIAMVFGGKPKGSTDVGDDSDDGDGDARSLFMEATGWDDDKTDALHEYIVSCVGKSKPKPMVIEDEEPESGRY